MPIGIYKRTKEHNENVSKALKGRIFSKEHGQNLSKANIGHIVSEETKRKIGKAHTIHGGSRTRLYKILGAMKGRCYYPNVNSSRYGARGITVCPEWLDKKTGFIAFRNWALSHGYNDSLEIHRRKHHLGYSPENCEWINPSKHRKWHNKFYWLKQRSKKFLEKTGGEK